MITALNKSQYPVYPVFTKEERNINIQTHIDTHITDIDVEKDIQRVDRI